MFIYGVFSNSNYHINTCSDDSNRKNLNFDLSNNKSLEVKLATSYISIEQAKNNLHQEIIDKHYSFDALRNQATNL
jgi:putative alpha-1,2-mannosidase